MFARDPAKDRAWRARSKQLTAGKALGRGTKPLTTRPDEQSADKRARNSTLNTRSPKRAAFYRDVRVPLVRSLIRSRVRGLVPRGAELTDAQADELAGARPWLWCQAASMIQAAGEHDPVGCWGPLTVHERLRRSQGGSLTNLLNLLVICLAHNGAAAEDDFHSLWRLVGITVGPYDPAAAGLSAKADP